MKKILQAIVLTMLLALAAAPAWALGLGQLQLKSKLGEPLLAEIPVISADPMELQDLEARLAAPETFLRVGLPLPDKMVSDLRFELAYDAGGKPLIRVTSPGPVAMPLLTFLLEVEWGEGRLVREYSVLLAEPDAVAAATQPAIEAPVAAPSNTIVREATPVSPQPTPMPAPAPQPAPVAAAPAPSPVPTAAAAAVAASHTVAAGDTLSAIAAGLRGPDQSLEAVMAALLRANPQAFIGNDPNLLRRGATLAIPAEGAVVAAGQDGSATALRAQLAGWRSARGQGRPAVDVASAAPDAPAATPAPARPRRARDARLEIIPAAAGATAGTGTRSGSGGEGDAEMTQQLQEARETIATRDAEVQELKSRVAELENLQQQQSQLIQMKDGQLASAQQQLNARQQAAPAVPANVQAQSQSMWVWMVPLGVVLLAALALVAWLRRRRAVVATDAAPSFVSRAPAPAATESRLSDDMASLFPVRTDDADPGEDTVPQAAPELRRPSWIGAAGAGIVANVLPVTDDEEVASGTGSGPLANEAMPSELAPGRGVFDAPDDAGADADHVDPLDEEAVEHIALARTYFELGDAETARALLLRIAEEGGPRAAEARQLLEGDGRA